MEEGKGWGVEGVEAVAGPSAGDTALQLWIRSSLNEQALGARLSALCSSTALLQTWYDQGAVLRREEAAGQVLGLLMGLDAVKVMLPVEPLLPSSTPEAREGLMASVGSFFPGSRRGATSTATPSQLSALSQIRKRTRAVTIDEAKEEPRPSPAAAAAVAAAVGGDMSPVTSDLLSTSFGALLLSPLSSTDLSAEPLSPNTTAAFQALRERHLAHMASATDDPGSRHAELVDQQPSHSRAMDLLAAPIVLNDGGQSGIGDDSGEEAPAPELAAFLDDLLAKPENSIFERPLSSEDDVQLTPGHPPPWRRLKPQLAEDALQTAAYDSAAAASEAGAARQVPSSAANSAHQQSDSYNSAEERRKAAELHSPWRQRSRKGPDKLPLPLQLEVPHAAEGPAALGTLPAASAPNPSDDTDVLSSSGSMLLSARSNEV